MANVPTQVEYPTNYATDLTLRSYADTDFVRWVDWAARRVMDLGGKSSDGM